MKVLHIVIQDSIIGPNIPSIFNTGVSCNQASYVILNWRPSGPTDVMIV